MALVFKDRVQQTGTANTTVSFTLSGAVTGFQAFTAIGDTNTTYYSAIDSVGNWEVGIGTYSTTGPTLTRTTILSSSNAGAAVTFSGAINVWCDYSATKVVIQDASGLVGIGIAAGTYPLTTYSATDGRMLIIGDGANTGYITSKYSNDNTGPTNAFRKYRGTLAVPLTVSSGDQIGALNFQAWGGTTLRTLAQVTGVVDTYVSDTSVGSYLTFNTTPNGSITIAERMRLFASGGLSLGNTTDPGAGNLSVTGGATIQGLTVGLGGGAVSTNTAVGVSALSATATGTYNVGIGRSALSSLTSGNNNSAIGGNSLLSLTSGTDNSSFGINTLQKITTGGYNTALGSGAQFNNISGSFNTSIGTSSLFNNITTSNLTAIGYQALYNNTTNVATLGTITGGTLYTTGTYIGVVMTLSSGSTAITYPTATIVVAGGAVTTVTITSAGVGFKDTTTVLTAPAASIGGTGSGFSVPVATLASGTNNTAVGYQALFTNSIGINNVANGNGTLYSNSTGSSNVASGFASLYANTTGIQNTAIGHQSLTAQNGNANNNTALGYQSGVNITTGGVNTCIGYLSGKNLTTGNYNTYIGAQSNASAGSVTNEIVITAGTSVTTGLGSNTTVIGNSSTTATTIYGSLTATNYSTINNGTNVASYSATNTGNSITMAIDNSAGSGFGLAYSSNLYTTGNVNFRLWVNGGVRFTLTPAGDAVISGATTSNAFIPASATVPSNGVFLPAANSVGIATASTNRLTVDASGNVLVVSPAGLGYGTGSGGTVTQLTSKTTGVTLNKPAGQITMNNAALAASAWVTFTFTNSLIAVTDNIVVSGSGFTGPYRISVDGVAAGSCRITVQNLNVASQSDALIVNFSIIKGAIA